MVFYYFGPDQSSWAFGNDAFGFANNLPPAIQAVWDQLGEPFEDKSMAGTRIQWMSTTPDGTSYAIMTKNGDLLSNVHDMLEMVKTQLATVMLTSVDHVTLSPRGGWFIRYNNSTVQLSGKFPDAFYAIASKYLDITNQQRQFSTLENIWFGADRSVLVKAGSRVQWDGIPQSVADTVTNLVSGTSLTSSYTLGLGTVLCPWEGKYYFLEAKTVLFGTNQYPYCLPDTQITSTELMTHLAQNTRAPIHLLPKPVRSRYSPAPAQAAAPPPTSSPSPLNPFHQVKKGKGPPNLSAEARARYEQTFNAIAQGRLYVNGNDAVTFMMESGLDTQTLAEIWELVDLDKNGKLDKSEFIEAMVHMDARRGIAPTSTATPLSVRETDGHITCDGCSRGLLIGEDVYYCAICSDGNFDLCTTCYSNVYQRCSHEVSKLEIRPCGEIQLRDTLGGNVNCDACGTSVYAGSLVYWCQVCRSGDFDICEDCWKAQKTCGHQLLIRKVDVSSSSDYTTTDTPTTDISHDPLPPGMPRNTTSNYSSWNNQDQPSEVDKLSKQFGDAKLKESLKSSILTEKPNVRWEDVAGLESAKAELQEAIIFPIRFPQMYRGKRKARRAILLYGPPGTGKSYLAKAVATEVDHTLFSVSSSDIMSKWIGESEGLMKQLFELAREKKPSIIFIDEIDAICGARDGGGANGEDTARMKTEFLVQMDGVGNNNDGVFVLAATNLPWSLDPAVRRRFQKRIHAGLPDENARKELFKVHLGEMSASLGDTDRAFTDLARRTDGYSGSDIANLIQDALMIPIRKVHSATHFLKSRDRQGEWLTPCEPGTYGAMPMKWSQVPGRQLKEPPLTMQDLYHAVDLVKPSVGAEEVRKCNEWTQQYGLEGA